MDGWIKLHRKVLESDVFNDPTAWRIFTWLLLKVDRKTGKKKIGRFWASKEVKLKPSTFYKGLMRLQNKYLIIKIVTDKVTIKYSEISLLNWNKYQSSNISEEQSSNNPVTYQEQSGNTLQEEEETKEDINNIDVKTSIEDEKIDIGKLVDSMSKEERIRHEYQLRGLEIWETLKAPDKKKSEFIRIVRDYPAGLVNEAYSFAKDYPVVGIRYMMFFKKLNQLNKKETNVQTTI